jgi:hypothetical protein
MARRHVRIPFPSFSNKWSSSTGEPTVKLGLGRIAALHCRSSPSYQVCEHIWNFYF